MSIDVRWHPRAEAELREAAAWYRAQDEGERLLARFETAVVREVNQIATAPERWPIGRAPYRQKVFASPFPYVVIYRTEGASDVIVALAHQRRRPAYWARR